MMTMGTKTSTKMRRKNKRVAITRQRGPPIMSADIVCLLCHRALSATSSSKSLIDSRPSDARINGSRHLWGTRRCRHFLSASGATPSLREAISVMSFQSMTDIDRDYQSLSQGTAESMPEKTVGGKIVPMAKDSEDTPGGHKKALLRRTQELREDRGLTQAEAAGQMGVKLETYKKWETRTAIPHFYIHRFCVMVETSEQYLLTGKPLAERRIPRKIAS